jgi:hypothetical protein
MGFLFFQHRKMLGGLGQGFLGFGQGFDGGGAFSCLRRKGPGDLAQLPGHIREGLHDLQ